MNFTPHQYRKVEQEFLQEFNLRSLEFYDQNINNQSLIEYKKLINLMQTRRKQYLKKKERFQMIRDKNNQRAEVDKIIQENEEEKDKLQEDDDEFGGFYITENYQSLGKKSVQSKKHQDTSHSMARSINSHIRHSSMTMQSKIIGSQTNENLNLDSLQDRIYTQYNVLESLSHEQSQVQQAIFCFKRRIGDLQEQLSSQNMKSKQVERLFVQNNNEMMHVKYTNQEVKSAFSKTKKHFTLDLDGRKQIQQKCSQENKATFQSSVINHIHLQKMKQKSHDQQKQLIELQQKKQDLDGKEKKYQSIYLKEQQFLRTYEAIMKINPSDFLKERLVSMLDKDFEQGQELIGSKKSLKSIKNGNKFNNLSRKSFPLINQSTNQQQSLPKIVNSLISLHKKMKHESIQKASEFKILISQKEEKEKQLAYLQEKIDSAYKSFQLSSQPKGQIDRSQLNKLVKMTNEIREKCEQSNCVTIKVEERIVFWLSKQLALVQKIMKAFLRYDKYSLKTFKKILQKTYDVPQLFKFLKHQSTDGSTFDHDLQQRQLHIEDSRNMLINCFQNWQNYIEYLYILHESKYIQNFISEKKLFKLFKRIIKTKLINKQIPTQQIFQKGIQTIFQESKVYHLGKIQKLLEIFKDMNFYFDKVKTGEVQIHCTINNESLTAIPDQNAKDQQITQYPTEKELIRNTMSKNKSSLKQKNSLLFGTNSSSKPQKSVNRSQEMYQTFSSTQKHLQPNNLIELSVISRLKKKKHMTSLLNIHGFYEQMREQMQKVHKMTVQ